VDEVGITSVKLQKILISLMIISVVNGGFISALVCLLGFIGAYKRNASYLRAYVFIIITIIIFGVVLATMSTFSMMGGTTYYYESTEFDGSNVYGSSSDGNTNNQTDIHPTAHSHTSRFSASLARTLRTFTDGDTNPNRTSSPTASPSSSQSTDSGSLYYYTDDMGFLLILSVLAFVFLFLLAYLEIYSIVLACRLRKMLLSPSALPVDAPSAQEVEFAPVNTSCAESSNEECTPAQLHTPPPFYPTPAYPSQPMFTPGFAPYPYAYYPYANPNGQQVPHPAMMFGQQPVFFSYAPVPQQPTPEDQ